MMMDNLFGSLIDMAKLIKLLKNSNQKSKYIVM